MRILMLSWEYPPVSVGGLARHVQDLSEFLVKGGDEVHVISQGNQQVTEDINGVCVHRVEAYPLSPPDFLSWVMQLNLRFLEEGTNLLRKKKFNILHAHDWLAAFCGRGLKHSSRLPLVATIHATESGRNQGLHNALQNYIHSVEWWLAYEAWKVIVCSRHMAYEVQGLFNLPADKVHVIPNGVNLDSFRLEQERWISHHNPHDKVIFYVGRLVREKGVHILINAAPRILAEFPQTRFIIAGKGPVEGELRHLANVLGIGQKIHFAGYVEDRTRNDLYRQASVAVFPSLYEPFGIVALEGMATGTPVVVSDTGGFHEIVEHGVTGLKAYNGNANSLADNILAILHDAELSDRLSTNALKLVKNKYSWKQIAIATHSLYDTVWKEYRSSDWVGENRLWGQGRKRVSSGNDFVPGLSRYSLMEKRIGNINLEEKEWVW